MQNRNISFDILRTIGLFAIILAHVSPPPLLFQIRNFDVVLMVLVSGAVYTFSQSSNLQYVPYLLKRAWRLLLPTWIFLSFYFAYLYLIGKDNSLGTILSAFALNDGIGYVWIIRVFILIALISPLLIHFYQKINNNKLYFLAIIFFYLVYELILNITRGLNLNFYPAVSYIINDLLFYALPYGCVAGLGILCVKIKRVNLMLLAIFFGFIFGIFVWQNINIGFVQTQEFKYPARLYFLSYSLMVSFLLYYLSYFNFVIKIFNFKIMKFIAVSSLWIYLWHIFYITIWKQFYSFLPDILQTYYIEYIFVLFLAVFTVYLQKLMVGKLIKKYAANKRIGSFLKTAFLK